MAFTPATDIEKVEALYVGYFGRAGEPGGVQYWVDQIQAGRTFAQVAAAFSVQAEAKAQHPFLANPDLVSPSDFVESLYQQLFGRASDADGKAYWIAQLQAANGNPFNYGLIVAQFISGAQGDDIAVIQNKIDAAEYFTGKLAAAGISGVDAQGQVTADVDAAATNVVTGVTKDTATVTAANAKTDTFVAGSDGGNGGQTFVFTTAVDNLKGTVGNDKFIGDDSGLTSAISAGDTINGGSGTDSANLFLTTATVRSINSTAVEVFNIQSQIAGATFNANNVTGATAFWSDDSTNALTVQNVQEAAAVGVRGGVFNANGNGLGVNNYTVQFKTGIAGATSTLNVALEGAAVANLLVGSADGNQDFNTIKINTTVASSGIVDILDGAGNQSLTKNMVFTGDQQITIGNALENVTSFDASAATGAVRIRVDGAAQDITFLGGKGNDRLDIGSAATLTAADKFDGGEGTGDIFRLGGNGGGLTAANAANVKGFEVVDITRFFGGTFDMDALTPTNTLTGLTLSGGDTVDGDTATINNITAAQAGNIVAATTDEGENVVLNVKSFVSGGTSDAAVIKMTNAAANDADGIDLGTVTFANVDSLVVSSTGFGGPAAATAGMQNSIASLVATDLEKLTITGSQSIAIAVGAGTNVTEVDASGLSTVETAALNLNLTNVAAGRQTLVTGTAQDDTVIFSGGASNGDTIKAGAGSDTVTLSNNAARDTVQYTATTLNSGDVAAGAVDNYTNFKNAGAGLVAADDIIRFDAALNNLLKVNGVNLGTTGADVILNQPLSATTNVAVIDTGANTLIQFDLNGDGNYTGAADFQITLTGLTGSVINYNAAGDFFYAA